MMVKEDSSKRDVDGRRLKDARGHGENNKDKPMKKKKEKSNTLKSTEGKI